MNLLQLKYFYAIAQAPTLTQAAADLHISQPSLSKLIHELEDEFQLKLFERSGRCLRLNENGQVFLKYTTDILDKVEEMRECLQDFREREDLSLRVGLFAASSLFPDIFTSFRNEYPHIKITVVQHSAEHNNNDNSLDLIFTAGVHPPANPNYIPLAEEEILLAVPNSHPLANCSSVSLAELKTAKFIMMSKGTTLRTIVDQYCADAGLRANVVLESDDPAMLRNLIQSGFGVAFVPEKTWMNCMKGDIHLLHIRTPRCIRYLYLIAPRNTYPSTAVRLFQHHLVRYFQNV